MTIRARDKQILLIVRKLIHDWDPYRLLEIGVPQDEWDREIIGIAGCVNRICPKTEISSGPRVIMSIFKG
jgi:hypothetical protein